MREGKDVKKNENTRENKRKRITRDESKGKENKPSEQKDVDEAGHFSIEITDKLRKRLADEYESVCENKKLVDLPGKKDGDTVRSILSKHIEWTTTSHKIDTKIAEEVSKGIIECFDRLLGQFLLYNTERDQYDQMMKDNNGAMPSEIYGKEHLLRLLVKLPELLARKAMEIGDFNILKGYITDILEYIEL